MPQFSIEPNKRVTFRIAYEDESLLVVEKPPKLVSMPGLGHDHDSLLNGLFHRYGPTLQNLGKTRDFGMLHRLDRDASGLLLVALTADAYDQLRIAFERGDVKKYYWALVRGTPNAPKGLIKKPIAEETGGKKLARISPKGKPAVTAYRSLETSDAGSLLECRTLTGRLHQLRVHLHSIGCPIMGDPFYGSKPVRASAPRLALHAHRIVVAHPITGERLDVGSPWPADLRATLRRAALQRPDLPPQDAAENAVIEAPTP
jgi:23S rRNA pseudouridine1911/1915/1917 synthase